MPNFANAQELVAIETIRDDTVIMKNGSLRQILMIGGINFSLKSEGDQNIVTQAYQNFLNSLNFPLQIVVHSRKINIDKYLSKLDERRQEEASALLQDQISEYEDFIRKFVAENAIMAKTFLVTVPFAPVTLPGKKTVLGSLPFFKKSAEAIKETAKEDEADFQENLAQLKQRVNQVMDGITAIGLEVLTLNNEQLIELFYNFYNPETIEKEKIPLPK